MEIEKYLKKSIPHISEETPGNPQVANWLSTIIRIGNKNWYILLTSDVEKKSLIRLDTKEPQLLTGKLILGQAPHHGSKHNHNNVFWRKRLKEKKTPMVFSVGENKYGHPNRDIISFFIRENFEIYSTNNLNGTRLISPTQLEKKNNDILTAFGFSEIPNQSSSKLSGDQTFQISNQGILMYYFLLAVNYLHLSLN